MTWCRMTVCHKMFSRISGVSIVPTETFFHLKKEKQERIMKAAEREFSRVSLKDASIAKIVEDAKIPRGSFYQYFEDKEDLYYFYFSELRQSSKRDLIKAVKHEDGDLFAGFEWYFSKMIFEVLKGKHANFYRNLFLSMDYHSFNRVTPEAAKRGSHLHHRFHQKKDDKGQPHLLDFIDREQLDAKDEHELQMLVQMLMHTVFSTVTEGYRHLREDPEYDVDQSIKDFNQKVQWLKNGAAKQAENKKSKEG